MIQTSTHPPPEPGSARADHSSNLRHDLLAVVHTLMGALELLLTTRLTARQRRYVNVCKRSAEHLTTLCKQVSSPISERSFERLAIDDLSQLGVSYVPKPVSRAQLIDAVKKAGDHRRLRILAADDSADSCALIDQFLKETAKRLDIVHDGVSALEKYQHAKGRYDLLLIDLDMPVMDGRTAIRAIRKWETDGDKPHVPILVLTAHDLIARREDSDREDLSGEDAVIVHPDPEIAHLVPGFLTGRRHDVEAILQSLADSNYDAIRTVGHMMKGTGGGYGFDEISEIGGKLEEAAHHQNFEQIREAVRRLDSYLDRVRVADAATPARSPSDRLQLQY